MSTLKIIITVYIWGCSYDITHVIFVTLRLNKLRDITAEMFGEICKDVKVEPMLCEIEKGEEMVKKSNNQARLDVSAVGFRTKGQRVFF